MRRTLACITGGIAFAACLLSSHVLAQSTMPFVSKDRLIYVGIEADYSGIGLEEVTRILTEDLGVTPIGSSLRSLANVQRRIFALRTPDPDATMKSLSRGAKKAGLVGVERLQATVLDSGVDPFTGTIARLVENNLDKIWASWIGPRGETLWLFHESRLTRRTLEKGLEKYEVRPNFHHRPFELSFTGEKEPDYAALETLAVQKLDLLRASRLEKGLSLDVYLRGFDSLLLIEHGGSLHVCPDFAGILLSDAKDEVAAWSVTFYGTGFPFL